MDMENFSKGLALTGSGLNYVTIPLLFFKPELGCIFLAASSAFFAAAYCVNELRIDEMKQKNRGR